MHLPYLNEYPLPRVNLNTQGCSLFPRKISMCSFLKPSLQFSKRHIWGPFFIEDGAKVDITPNTIYLLHWHVIDGNQQWIMWDFSVLIFDLSLQWNIEVFQNPSDMWSIWQFAPILYFGFMHMICNKMCPINSLLTFDNLYCQDLFLVKSIVNSEWLSENGFGETSL